MRFGGTAALAALSALTLSVPALADTVTLAPSMDCTLYAEDGGLANCAGQGLFVGENASGSVRRSVLAFDVASSMPSGSTVTAVKLRLAMTRTRAAVHGVAVHRVAALWTEGTSVAAGQEGRGAAAATGDATWTHRVFNSASWASAGGDFVSSSSATTNVGPALQAYEWSGAGLVSDVQGWLNTPASNLGWMLVGDETAIQTSQRFGSRESGAAERPTLEITFTPPATTGACCATGGACSVVLDPGSSCTGTYQGASTTCSPNTCPQPAGACCLPDADATCQSLTSAACTTANGVFQGPSSGCTPNPCKVELTPFVDPLPIPAVAQPVSGVAGGEASYRISTVEMKQQLHSELPATTVWAYSDGQTAGFPGPTIEARTGQNVEVEWVNDLRDETGQLRTKHILPVDHCPHGAHSDTARVVTHLHGGHVPAEYDGYPELTLLPGETTVYQYPNWQDASTLWYHDHALGITRLNVMMGLAGLYVIRDDHEESLHLPAGEFEIPLVIQDRSFNPDGSFKYPAMWMEHFFGDKLLVNGKVWPYLDVKRGRYRFRILNGANSRFLKLTLSGGARFQLIGTDGGLLRHPIDLTELTLGPAERADVILDFTGNTAGDEIVMTNSAVTPYPQGGIDEPVTNVMKFVVGSQPGALNMAPQDLRTIDALDPATALFTRDFQLEKGDDACTGRAWLINGLHWDDITERPLLGSTEVWRFVNRSGITHPMHMHLVFFQVLDRQPIELIDDKPVPTGTRQPPLPEETGWKDTVQVGPFEVVRVIAKFDDFVGKFPYHCHILEHEDQDMMRQFETRTDCGDGVRGLPVEECDDGNDDTHDACPSGLGEACMPARCGDGYVWNTDGGDESCDDAGESATCDADCSVAECGDGTRNSTAGESCDDGNTASGDGCDGACQAEACSDCDAGPDAGVGGAAGSGSRGGGDDGGCGCSVPGGSAPASDGLVALGLGLWLWRRRRGAAWQ